MAEVSGYGSQIQNVARKTLEKEPQLPARESQNEKLSPAGGVEVILTSERLRGEKSTYERLSRANQSSGKVELSLAEQSALKDLEIKQRTDTVKAPQPTELSDTQQRAEDAQKD